MSQEDRGMMKWAPYKSLIEQGSSLDELKKRKQEVDKPRMSSEEAEGVNDILSNHQKEDVVVVYWIRRHLYKVEGKLVSVDSVYRNFLVNETKISFSSIVSINLK